jgi:type II secretory pathway component GspD/PulD (secretin)
MTRARTVLLLLFVLAVVPLAARAAAIRLDNRIDLNVTDADVGKLFQTVGQLTGARVELDPRFQTARKISIRIDNVTLRTALTAICESLGCRWRTKDGAIFVEPVRTGEPVVNVLDQKIDLRITGANLREVMETMSMILGADLAFDETLAKGKLSLDIGQETIAATLDAACAQAGCKWKLENRDPKPVLQITAR